MSDQSVEDSVLLDSAKSGDADALNSLILRHRERLKRMVKLRLNPALRGRVDESDIIQDACVEAAKRFPEYVKAPKAPFFLWMRQIVGHKLIDAHRVHLDADKRAANREISIHRGSTPSVNSTCLAEKLLGRFSSPSAAAVVGPTMVIAGSGSTMKDEMDREILALRHFEQLTNLEAAGALGIDKSTASKRYVRALARLKTLIDQVPGILPGSA